MKSCRDCRLKNICRMFDIISNKYHIVTTCINGNAYNFAETCLLYVHDDIRELSLPDINKIEVLGTED